MIDERGLYLRAPDGQIYAISALPAEGTDVMSVSVSGRLALLRGPYGDGLPIGVLDLETTAYRQVIATSHDIDIVKFTADGEGLWIYDLIPASERDYLQTVQVSRIDLGDHHWETIIEETYDVELGNRYYSWWVNHRGGVVELANGGLAISTPTGIVVGPPSGPFELLGTPNAPCSVADGGATTSSSSAV